MTDQHPITPPPELFREWTQYKEGESVELFWKRITTQAARWGADQELEACCQDVHQWYGNGNRLRTARRPKPTQKELIRQALEQIDVIRELLQ